MSGYVQIGGHRTSLTIAMKRWGAPYGIIAFKVTTPLTRTMRCMTLRADAAPIYVCEDSAYRAFLNRYKLGAKILWRKFDL